MNNNLKIISAGAGSGKTYRLTSEMVAALERGEVRASGIIATTFTNKAAAELQERVRTRLLEQGLATEADELTNALIGTVHGLGVKLLKRFAFEAGVSPEVDIIADEDQQTLFNNSLAAVLKPNRIHKMENLAERLGLNKTERYDWRQEVKKITDVARANAFDETAIEKSKVNSIDSFMQFLPPISEKDATYFNEKLKEHLQFTITQLRTGDDSTKTTQKGINTLQFLYNKINQGNVLNWHEWVKITKIKVGKKSLEHTEELKDFAAKHERHPDFHQHLKEFIEGVFDIAIEAKQEYENYKKRRGLIDYVDMETHIKGLLENPSVAEVLKEELDLLMVDEFQDTSPIQLEIFFKLSQFAKQSIWVGDPKQSIYGFRGADPALMQAIIAQTGGIKPEDIQEYSWRSREEIVYAVNALFVKAFPKLPPEQVYLKPKREKINDPIEQGSAIVHWHFEYDGKSKRLPGKPWTENAIARSVKEWLERKDVVVVDKESKEARILRPSDISILCRSNAACQTVAEALHREGLKAAIARNGLLQTAESKLILACLKFILNQNDSLSVAEILLLAADKNIETIIENRLGHRADGLPNHAWAKDNHYIKTLNDLRKEVEELSGSEILNLILETLDLRRIIASWGNMEQRFANIDALRQFALKYEENCNRLHTAASLPGFLLWLTDLERDGGDAQGSGENEDAVNVMTYHKSKGLEWAVVICHSLEGGLRDSVWGVQIVPETETVDLDNILGNRWLRYWINPYADQMRNTPLEERLNASSEKSRAKIQALEEEARLMYVGMTRARDYLVMPTRAKSTNWLNRCWHGNEAVPTLIHHDYETQWVWNNEPIVKETEVRYFPKDFEYSETDTKTISYLAESEGAKDHPLFFIDIENDDFSKNLHIKVKDPLRYHDGFKLDDDADKAQVAKAIKAFFAVDYTDFEKKDRKQIARTLLDNYSIDDNHLKPKELLFLSDAFFDFIDKRFKIKKIYRKHIVQTFYHDRLFEKYVDFIAETDKGWIIIQNSSQSKPKKWKNKARSLGSWLFFAQKGVREGFNIQNQPIYTFIHFVMGGGLVEVKIREDKQLKIELF